jgi:hypothetical protein
MAGQVRLSTLRRAATAKVASWNMGRENLVQMFD